MFEKTSKTLFVFVFMIMLIVPLLTTNLINQKVSESENRKLAAQPVLYDDEGNLNEEYIKDFENWLNDNIGLRSSMVVSNAQMLYRLFKVFPENTDYYLGPNGELNYATDEIISDYQHLDLYDDDYLSKCADAVQTIADYVEDKEGVFVYYQCWDKQTIYPEYFPKTVLQHGSVSKTDGILKALNDNTSVSIVSSKNILINAKNDYETYSVWGNATHWTERGAYIAYVDLIDQINRITGSNYTALSESDYDIQVEDLGENIYGGIHETDMLESFTIKNPRSVSANERLGNYTRDYRHFYNVNNSVDNDTRLLIVGNSYFRWYIADDLSESFHETIYIWTDYIRDLKTIIDIFEPDIVLLQNAERVDKTDFIVEAARRINEAN